MDHCEKRGQIFKVAMKLLYFVFLFLYLYFCASGHLESLQGGEPDLDWEVGNIFTKPLSSLSLFFI